MKNHPSVKPALEIFSGAMWSQRTRWRKVVPLLPANTCLLAVDTQNEPQTRLMRQVARAFRERGWQVLIWLNPSQGQSAEFAKQEPHE